MLRYWILERARQAVVGSDGNRVRRTALDVVGALTMVAVGLAVL